MGFTRLRRWSPARSAPTTSLPADLNDVQVDSTRPRSQRSTRRAAALGVGPAARQRSLLGGRAKSCQMGSAPSPRGSAPKAYIKRIEAVEECVEKQRRGFVEPSSRFLVPAAKVTRRNSSRDLKESHAGETLPRPWPSRRHPCRPSPRCAPSMPPRSRGAFGTPPTAWASPSPRSATRSGASRTSSGSRSSTARAPESG